MDPTTQQKDTVLGRLRSSTKEQLRTVQHYFDNNDAGISRALCLRHLEAKSKIYDWNHATAQVDDTGHKIGRPWNDGNVGQVKYLSHLGHIRCENLIAEFESQVLPRLRNFTHAHGRTPLAF